MNIPHDPRDPKWKGIRWPHLRLQAMEAADRCFLAAVGVSAFVAQFLPMKGGSMVDAVLKLGAGMFLSAPVSLPCILAGHTIDLVFYTKPLHKILDDEKIAAATARRTQGGT